MELAVWENCSAQNQENGPKLSCSKRGKTERLGLNSEGEGGACNRLDAGGLNKASMATRSFQRKHLTCFKGTD